MIVEGQGAVIEDSIALNLESAQGYVSVVGVDVETISRSIKDDVVGNELSSRVVMRIDAVFLLVIAVVIHYTAINFGAALFIP